MNFDKDLLARISEDSVRLSTYDSYVGPWEVMSSPIFWIRPQYGGGGVNFPRDFSGVIPILQTALGRNPENVLVLGPGTTFELEELWRFGSNVTGIDKTLATFDYGPVRFGATEFDERYDVQERLRERIAAVREFTERIGIPLDRLALVKETRSCPLPWYEKLVQKVVESLGPEANFKVSPEEDQIFRYAREIKEGVKLKPEAVAVPEYSPTPIPRGQVGECASDFVSIDGKVRGMIGNALARVPELNTEYDAVVAVKFFDKIGIVFYKGGMTERLMWNGWDDTLMTPSVAQQEIVPFLQQVASKLVPNGVFVIKNIYDKSFVTDTQLREAGLSPLHLNRETPQGYFTVARK